MSDPLEARFAVDAMLQKLGSYLRCMGFDAAFVAHASTATRVEHANREGRIFLTRNRRLPHQRPSPERSLVLESSDPLEQLEVVRAAFGLGEERLFTRCIRCNVALEEAGESVVRERVPEPIRGRYARFYRCPSCGTVFWKGSHVRNTCRKLGLGDAAELPDPAEGAPGA